MLFLVLNVVGVSVMTGVAGQAPGAATSTATSTLVWSAAIYLVSALGATAIMLRSIDVRPWADVGLDGRSATLRPLLGGWCVGTIAIGLACGLLFLGGWMRIVPNVDGPWLVVAARLTAVLLLAALAEEVVCRGYLLTAVGDGLGRWPAVLITSVLFGLAHIPNAGSTVQSVLLVTLAGIFLAAVRIVFASLYAAWTAHAAWNWVLAVPLHAPVSGIQFDAPDYRAVSSGPAWVSGGQWGPEGGVFAALGLLAGLAILHRRARRAEP